MRRTTRLIMAACACFFMLAHHVNAGSPDRPDDLEWPGETDDFWKDDPHISVDHNVNGSDIIWYAGHVSGNAASLFRKVLEDNDIAPGATVMLHSPGGDPIQGMLIGRMMREHSLRASIGRRPASGPNKDKTAEKGLCISACSIIFLGGVIRTVPPGSYYVIHTIAPMVKGGKTPSRGDPYPKLSPVDKYLVGMRRGERGMAAPTLAYLAEMGIDPAWYVQATNWDTENGQAYWVSNEEMAQWHVTTDKPDTNWALVPKNGSVYLVGKSPGSLADAEHQNELSFVCSTPRHLAMNIYYAPTKSGLLSKVTGYKIVAPHPSSSSGPPSSGAAPGLVNVDPSWIVEPFHPVSEVSGNHIFGTIAINSTVMSVLEQADDLNFRIYTGESQYQGFDVDLGSQRDLFKKFVDVCG